MMAEPVDWLDSSERNMMTCIGLIFIEGRWMMIAKLVGAYRCKLFCYLQRGLKIGADLG